VDTAPVVTIGATMDGNQSGASIEKSPVTAQGDMPDPVVSNISLNATFHILCSAFNPGGVKKLTIKIHKHTVVAFDLTKDATPNAQQMVPKQLDIVVNPTGQVLDVLADDLVTVEVSATNFNNMTTTATMVYYPINQTNRMFPQITNVTLGKTNSSSLFSAQFPGQFSTTDKVYANGRILALLNENDQTVHLLSPTGLCSSINPSTTVFLNPHTLLSTGVTDYLTYQQTFSGRIMFYAGDLSAVYGSNIVSFSAILKTCEETIDPAHPSEFSSKTALVLTLIYQYY